MAEHGCLAGQTGYVPGHAVVVDAKVAHGNARDAQLRRGVSLAEKDFVDRASLAAKEAVDANVGPWNPIKRGEDEVASRGKRIPCHVETRYVFGADRRYVIHQQRLQVVYRPEEN